jgi:hypothetical protein
MPFRVTITKSDIRAALDEQGYTAAKEKRDGDKGGGEGR